MLKDNENISLPHVSDEPDVPPQAPFAPDQMLRCEGCLRANPPTRVNCLYCGATLPQNESSAALQRPALRPLEVWEQGYNNILIPPAANLTETALMEAASCLRLRPEDLTRILSAETPLPLARASSPDEAELIKNRISALGINSLIFPDQQGLNDQREIVKVRSLNFDEHVMFAYPSPETAPIKLPWADLVLFVTGRLLGKRVELKEVKGKRAENRITAASEFATDERVIDLYVRDQSMPYRIAANSFDFSCLGSQKRLVSGENIERLIHFLRERALDARYDDSFNSVRRALEPVWPATQQIDTGGWRRERPGKISLGTVTESNNETQFLRYSRLRYYLVSKTRSDQ